MNDLNPGGEKMKICSSCEACAFDLTGTVQEHAVVVDHTQAKLRMLEFIRDSFDESKKRDGKIIAGALLGDFGLGKSQLLQYFQRIIEECDYQRALDEIRGDEPSLRTDHIVIPDSARGLAMRIDARTLHDELGRRASDKISPFFEAVAAKLGIDIKQQPKEQTIVQFVTTSALDTIQGTPKRLFIFIDEMEGLRGAGAEKSLEVFLRAFFQDLRTLLNPGNDKFRQNNFVSLLFATVPDIWEEFRRHYSAEQKGAFDRIAPYVITLEHFTLPKAYGFISSKCPTEEMPFTEGVIRALHLACAGIPRSLNQLCRLYHGKLPADKKFAPHEITIRTLEETTVRIGEEDYTYAFDAAMLNSLKTAIKSRPELGSNLDQVFSLLVGEMKEFTVEEVATRTGMNIDDAKAVLDTLASKKIVGIALVVCKVDEIDYKSLSTNPDEVLRYTVPESEIKQVEGKLKVYQLDFFDDILERLNTTLCKDEPRLYLSQSPQDLSSLWGLEERKARDLGLALRQVRKGETKYRLSESVKGWLFPELTHKDLPFLSNRRWYEIFNVLKSENRELCMFDGLVKVFKENQVEVRDRGEDECILLYPSSEIEKFDRRYVDNKPVSIKVLLISDEETFRNTGYLSEKLANVDAGLLICTQYFGEAPPVVAGTTGRQWREVLVRDSKDISKKAEEKLQMLSRVKQEDIEDEDRYRLVLRSLFQELRLDDLLQEWLTLIKEQGYAIYDWQAENPAEMLKAARVMVSILPSMPTDKTGIRDAMRSQGSHLKTLAEDHRGVLAALKDLETNVLIHVSGNMISLSQSPVEKKLCEEVKALRLTQVEESAVDTVQGRFWGFCRGKREVLRDTLAVAIEKGFFENPQEQLDPILAGIQQLITRANEKDEFDSSAAAYCSLLRKGAEKGLDRLEREGQYYSQQYTAIQAKGMTIHDEPKLKLIIHSAKKTQNDLNQLVNEGLNTHSFALPKIRDAQAEIEATVAAVKEAEIQIKENLGIKKEKLLYEMVSRHKEGRLNASIEEGVDPARLLEDIRTKMREVRDRQDKAGEAISGYEQQFALIEEQARRLKEREAAKEQLDAIVRQLEGLRPDKIKPSLMSAFKIRGLEEGIGEINQKKGQLEAILTGLQSIEAVQEQLENLKAIKSNLARLKEEIDQFGDSYKLPEVILDGETVPVTIPKNLLQKELNGIEGRLSKAERSIIERTASDELLGELNKERQGIAENFSSYKGRCETYSEKVQNFNEQWARLSSVPTLRELSAIAGHTRDLFEKEARSQATEMRKAKDDYEQLGRLLKSLEETVLMPLAEGYERLQRIDTWLTGLDFKTERYNATACYPEAETTAELISKLGKELESFPSSVSTFNAAIEKLKTIEKGPDDWSIENLQQKIAKLNQNARSEVGARRDKLSNQLGRFYADIPDVSVLRERLQRAHEHIDSRRFNESIALLNGVEGDIIKSLSKNKGNIRARLIVMLSESKYTFSELKRLYEERYGSFGDQERKYLWEMLEQDEIEGTFGLR